MCLLWNFADFKLSLIVSEKKVYIAGICLMIFNGIIELVVDLYYVTYVTCVVRKWKGIMSVRLMTWHFPLT